MSEFDQFKAVMAACLQVDPSQITETVSQSDIPSWDSLAMMNLIAELEAEFDISFEVAEIVQFKTVKLIMDIMRSKGIDFPMSSKQVLA